MMMAKLRPRCALPISSTMTGELLHRGDNDLPALFNEAAQIPRAFRMGYGGPHLGVLPDGVADLLIQNAAVGDHDDGIEDEPAVALQPDELMGQPGDGITLAAAGGMLNQIPLPRPVLAAVLQEPPHHLQLMVSGPDLHLLALAGLAVLRLHQLGVVFQNVGHAPAGEDVAPQVIRLDAVRVGGIAGALLPTPIERQEPGRLALEMGAETAPGGRPPRNGPRTTQAGTGAPGGCGPAYTAQRRPPPSAG